MRGLGLLAVGGWALALSFFPYLIEWAPAIDKEAGGCRLRKLDWL